jgi:hypothetical protein
LKKKDMPSSLAAALAASKKGGPAAANASVKNEDEYPSSRPSSLQQHVQKKDDAVSRLSTLKQHNEKKDDVKRDERETTTTKGQREKMKKHDGTSNNNHKKDSDKIKDPAQREKTPPNEGYKNPDDEGGAKPTTKRGKKKEAKVSPQAKNYDIATGQIVFVCDIPSDGDDDDGDCKDYANVYDGGRSNTSAKRRGRRKRAKAPTPPVKIADNTTGEIVFLCDIPSDSDDNEDECDRDYSDDGDGNLDDDDRGDGADEEGECESVVDDLERNVVVMTDDRQKNTARNRGNGDRGNGGRSGRDDRSSQGPQVAGRGGDRGALMHGTPGRGNNAKCGGTNVRRGNNESLGDGGKDRHIHNLPVNPGAMPTPWSIRAQATKNNNDAGIYKQGDGARSGGKILRSGNTTTAKGVRRSDRHIGNPQANPSSMATPWSARAEAMKNNDACDKRENDARAGLHSRDHSLTGGTSSRGCSTSGAPHPNPTIASANTCIESGYEKEFSVSSAIKLESTAIKGRWADEDSSEDE